MSTAKFYAEGGGGGRQGCRLFFLPHSKILADCVYATTFRNTVFALNKCPNCLFISLGVSVYLKNLKNNIKQSKPTENETPFFSFFPFFSSFSFFSSFFLLFSSFFPLLKNLPQIFQFLPRSIATVLPKICTPASGLARQKKTKKSGE